MCRSIAVWGPFSETNFPLTNVPEDCFAIEHSSILLLFVHKPHCDTFLYPSDNDVRDIEDSSHHPLIDP